MRLRAFVQRHPISVYFVLTYLISWSGALLIVAPKLIAGKSLSQVDGLLMFPLMLLGPSVAGLTLTAITEGRSGLRALFARMGRWLVGRWYLTLLIAPALALAVLFLLRATVSPAFTPRFIAFGIIYGVAPGIIEEIGWTGFVYPRMRARFGALPAALLLGPLWGLWHLPVIDFLGAAYPHGAYWLPFALAFIVAMSAMRVLISWVYCNTGSTLMAQLLHIISTGTLTILSPFPLTPAQEALWYGLYAIALWVAVSLIVVRYGRRLTRRTAPAVAFDTEPALSGAGIH